MKMLDYNQLLWREIVEGTYDFRHDSSFWYISSYFLILKTIEIYIKPQKVLVMEYF